MYAPEMKEDERRCLAMHGRGLTERSLNYSDYLDQRGEAGKGKEMRSTAGLGTDWAVVK